MRPLQAWTSAAAALLVVGCAAPLVPPPAPLVLPATYTSPGGDAAVEPDWWRAFGDAVLERLVLQALQRNADVRLAGARVAEARALSQAQHGAALPNAELAGGLQRARTISPVTGLPYDATTRQVQFQAAYEIDLWGRVDALGRAADAGLAA